MPRLRIKNFGPIKEGFVDEAGNEWMDIRKVTVFIGNQGTGKSTVAKVIATMMWLEKSVNRGDIPIPATLQNLKRHFGYQSLQANFREDTFLEYEGDAFAFKYDRASSHPITRKMEGEFYKVPKLMYVPAERNFLSTIKNVYNISGLPKPLFTFAEEMRRAQNDVSEDDGLALPIDGYTYFYNRDNEQSYVRGKDHEVNLIDASSGFHSIVPLYLVSWSLANLLHVFEKLSPNDLNVNQALRMREEIAEIMLTDHLLDEEKIKRVESIKNRYQSAYFVNIVEEPEQNLFPESQWAILTGLLRLNNFNEENTLILTTHSPYTINYLTLAIKADGVLQQIVLADKEQIIPRLDRIVPSLSTVAATDAVIYELSDGKIRKLPDYNGLPSDENYLNEMLSEGNELFAQLLEIQQEL